MKRTVFGATGRTGRPLRRQALERGHEVVGHVRSPETIDHGDVSRFTLDRLEDDRHLREMPTVGPV
ncbi:NAD(P)H-binding protein [Natrinema longum]|uniref:NAD(P)H-binding protein n=1 Tax=Natrinema longum TaxID=370324 RepID=A0A8A2U9Y0_9EURY|nr:NAD(P)H-binding protein [Natrinema longum]MBZ6496658.1 NAD(P)H-binding protein [Natrinema longum]QSW85447.1 NAD(P)H-binding protein [Natrinema longum]